MDDVVNLTAAIEHEVAKEPWLLAASAIADQSIAVLADRKEIVPIKAADWDRGAVARIGKQIPQTPGWIRAPCCGAKRTIPDACIGDAAKVRCGVNGGITWQLDLDATHQVFAGRDVAKLPAVKPQER